VVRKCFLPILFTSLLLSLMPTVSAFYDTFQYHPNNDLTQPDIYGVRWKLTKIGGTSEIVTQDINNKIVHMTGGSGGGSNITQITPQSCSNYWSFYVGFTGYIYLAYIRFYDSDENLISSSKNLENWFEQNPYSQWELLRSGDTIAVYVNGKYLGDLGGTWDRIPCFIEFEAHFVSGFTDLYIDNVMTGDSVISCLPLNWYILRNWDNPSVSGLYDDSDKKVSTHHMKVFYMWRNVTSYSERAPPCDKIIIKYFTTGEIVNQTSIPSAPSFGMIKYNFTDMLFHDDPTEDKYGLYEVDLMRGGDVIAQDWFFTTFASAEKTISGTISWDKDSYASGEIARIHTNISNPDFTTYLYKGYVYDIYGNKKEEWTISSADEWYEVDLNGYDAGVYYAILKIRNKNTGFEWEEAWDVTSVSEEVRIEGVSYDAKSETVLGGVYVNAIQNYEDHETITNETTGEYNISKLTVDIEIQMNASKTNYTHNNFSFTPLQNGLYEINLFLLPDASHINVTAPAIVGLTQSYPFHQNVSYATVNIWNETWSANATTNSMGYFAFENLSPGIYYLNATREGYKPSETYEVNLSSGEIEYVYILMHGLYNLTVKARDVSTHATIFNFKATLNDGEQVKETTIGWLNFTSVEYGIHKVEVGADGYYSTIEYVYVYGDVEKIVYLMPLETTTVEQGVGISYPPHQVEFVCVDMFGNPLANIYVEATPISTTTGAWDWLLKLFGIRNESITYFTNQTLNGTTDSRGAITFVMMENVEYEVNFRNESLGINKTIRIYPKADHYTVMLTPVTSSIVSSEDYITFNLSYEIIDEEEINLSLTYNDALGQTQNLTFFVYNSTTLLYQQNFTNTSNISVSYTVPYKAGEEYMWGYSAFHSNFGEMGRSRILRIAWFLDLGISRTYCTWIAIAIILFLTAMFSFTTVKFGYVAIPIVSLIFAFIGWLPNISIIIIALCLGILAYMGKREKEVGV